MAVEELTGAGGRELSDVGATCVACVCCCTKWVLTSSAKAERRARFQVEALPTSLHASQVYLLCEVAADTETDDLHRHDKQQN